MTWIKAVLIQGSMSVTPQYAKIKAVADDPRGDPATRAAAQKQIDKWRVKMEGVLSGEEAAPRHGSVGRL